MKYSLPNNIAQKLTERARRAVEHSCMLAQRFPVETDSSTVTPLHLLAAIARQDGGIGAMMLKTHDISNATLLRLLEKSALHRPQDKPSPKIVVSLSTELQAALTRAVNTAAQMEHRMVGTEHLLYGLIGELEKTKQKTSSTSLRTKLSDVKERLEDILSSTARFPDIAELFDVADESDDADADTPRRRSSSSQLSPTARLRQRMQQHGGQTPHPALTGSHGTGGRRKSAIDHFTNDLTEKADDGKLDPLIGREQEVQRMVNILNRRVKNNPALIGEPGTGKTAIVHGLAQRIADGNVPPSLTHKRILSLDLGLLVAGTIFRGEFEGRLKELIQEVQSRQDIILFIDEIHTIVGAGSAQGSLDAANMLKPALADGSLRVIGATTLDEYRKHIESDAALERRFQAVHVKEQTVPETIDVLNGLKRLYEEHHNVVITDNAIEAAVRISERYITDRFLPDKAIDLIDEASAHVRSTTAKKRPHAEKVANIEKELGEITAAKEMAIVNESYQEALNAKHREMNLRDLLHELKRAQREEEKSEERTITAHNIEAIASQMTGIPLQKIHKEDLAKLEHIEGTLANHIVGQNEAISSIAKTLRRAHVGLADPNRPLGSFLFLGPTGVGKTETARVLAREIFDRDDALIKLDMSEFLEPHSIARLIGAPPGYVGYEQEGMLTERVRRNPYSVILLDEIEKAHPKVYNILLQILEDGTLTSASGREVNFRNTIVIITSNIGTKAFTKEATLGFRDTEGAGNNTTLAKRYGQIKNEALKELQQRLTPELLNRINHTIVFKPLTKTAIRDIVELHMQERTKRMVQQDTAFTYTKGALKYLAEKAWKPKQGARPVRQTIEHEVEDRVTEAMIAEQNHEPKKIHVTTRGNELVVKLD